MKYTGCFSRAEVENGVDASLPGDSMLISIRDPGSHEPRLKDNWTVVVYLEFWDIDKKYTWEGDSFGAQTMEPATQEQLSLIHSFVKNNPTASIFAHCEGGISRSSAVREYLIRNGWAFVNAAQARRKVHPNMWVLTQLQRMDGAYE